MDEAARSVRRCDAAEGGAAGLTELSETKLPETKRPPGRSSKWLNSNRIGGCGAIATLPAIHLVPARALTLAAEKLRRFKTLIREWPNNKRVAGKTPAH